MNDTVRIHSNRDERLGDPEQLWEDGVDGCFIRLQESTANETYYDGDIDCVHEL